MKKVNVSLSLSHSLTFLVLDILISTPRFRGEITLAVGLPLTLTLLQPSHHPPSVFRHLPSAFRHLPSAFRLPPSAFTLPPSPFRLPTSAFRLPPYAFHHGRKRLPRRLYSEGHLVLQVRKLCWYTLRNVLLFVVFLLCLLVNTRSFVYNA